MPVLASSRRRLILVGLVLLYLTGYLAARVTHVLIHRVAYATAPHGEVYFHAVTAGDFGPGLLQSHGTLLLVPAAYIIFTPLRWAESLVWRFIPS